MKRTRRVIAFLLTCALLFTLGGGAWAAELTPETPAEASDGAELADVTNIAQGKTATASSSGANFPVENAVDGDSASYWGTPWGSTSVSTESPIWLQVDLGAGKTATVSSIVLKFRGGQYSNDYTISTASSEDGSWTTIYTLSNRTGGASDQTDTITSLSQDTLQRYVRVTFTSQANANAIQLYELEINGELTAAPLSDDTNLCRPGDGAVVTATVSDYETSTSTGSQAIDGDKTTHWGTAQNAETPWIVVDLGAVRNVSSVTMYWECLSSESTAPASGYKIYASETVSDGSSGEWGEAVYTSDTSPSANNAGASAPAVTASFTATQARYIKLQVTGYRSDTGWANVGIHELEVYGTGNTVVESAGDPENTPDGNLALASMGSSATASAIDASAHSAAMAIDGDTASTRWASETAASADSPQWLQIDLGQLRSISMVKLYWEQTSVTAYTLQVSENGSTWTTVHERTSRLTELNETITFTQTNARYVKVVVTAFDNLGSASWSSVSLYEVEVYRDENAVPASAATALAALPSAPLEVSGNSVTWTSEAQAVVDANSGYNFSFAADYEQLVGADGTIYTPLVPTTASFDITVTSKTDEEDTAASSASSPIALVIPGTYSANAGNDKPAVIPELMEWYSSAAQSGLTYALTESSRVVAPSALNDVAEELQADIADLFGITPEIVTSGATTGDIVLTLGTGDAVAGFDDETYTMDVTDKVEIVGSAATGVYWGTRSALQALKLSGDQTIPQGKAKDYPKYRLRGFILDVGRKATSMEMLETIVKNMAWYKMNDFHVHLNDDLIFMEDYGVTSSNYTDPDTYAEANKAYSAFRLESDVEEESDGLPLEARDYSYSKAEYKAFVEESASLGVNIVSEIDVPAHAKAITDAFPSLRLTGFGNGHPWNDHLDLTNKYTDSLNLVKSIFNDYIATDENGAYDAENSVFGSTVHFGADEYYDSGTSYRTFVKDMIAYLKDIDGVTPRVWGSLSQMTSNTVSITKEEASGVEMNVWNSGWAVPADMYELGFDLINCLDGSNYIVPAAGYYGDKYGSGKYTWEPNNFGGTYIPASSSQMAGGAFAIWNDSIDTRANGIDEQDIFVRFYSGMPYYACALWGVGDMTQTEAEESVAVTGYAPQTNPRNEIDTVLGTTSYAQYDFTSGASDISGNGRDLTLSGAAVEDGVLTLSSNSYAVTGLDKLPWDSQLSFRVRVDEPGILFESDAVYDEYTIKAVLDDTDSAVWHLTFEREFYDFTYDVDLPVGEWVTLTLVNNERSTELYVGDDEMAYVPDGTFQADVNGNGNVGVTFTSGEYVINSVSGGSSFSIPVARIGSATSGASFTGAVDDVVLAASGANIPSPVESGKYDIDPSNYTATAGTEYTGANDADGPIGYALDGDSSTWWHSDYSDNASPTLSDFWASFDLGSVQTVSGLRYLPRNSGTNGIITTYKIETSTDGTTWKTAVASETFSGTSGWQTATFDAVDARYVRFTALATLGNTANEFVSAAEIRVCRAPDLEADGAVASFAEDSYALNATPVPLVSLDGAALTVDKDFTVTYVNNDVAGTATATITGTGAYTGSITLTYTVSASDTPDNPDNPDNPDAVDLSGATVTLPATSYTYTGSAITPTPTVTLDGVTLTAGTDYTVTYSNNTAVGTATVTVTGTGNYTGAATATFTIVKSGDSSGTTTSSGTSKPSASTGSDTGTTLPSEATTTTVTDPVTGAVTETTVYPDGSTYEKVTLKNGTVTETTIAADGTKTQRVENASGSVVKTVTEPSGRTIQTVDVPDRGLTITVTDPLGEVDVAVSLPSIPEAVENAYVDVPEGHWSETAVNTVSSLGLFKGDEQGRFQGDVDMSRGMVATVLHRLSGEVSKMPVGFVDVAEDAYYAEALDWAASIQVIQGVGQGKCEPDRAVTRQELATILYRYAKLIDAQGKPIAHGVIGDFNDSAEVSSWATDAMDWAVTNGIITGRDGKLLAPNASATRAEVAAIFTRLVELFRP